MPINPSDVKFFNWLHDITDSTKINTVPDINIIRSQNKKLNVFVDSPADIEFNDIQIPSRNGNSIRLRYYHSSHESKPLIIYLPGNGFIYDLFEANHSIISKIAKYTGCHAIMIDYRLAPEHPYPAPLEDAIDAINYLFDNLTKFHADKSKIILSGYSSGANLAAVITNQSRNNSKISIYHQLLISGAYDYTNSLHDYDDFGIQDRMLSPDEALFSFNAYCSDNERTNPTCSPYWETDLSGLPKTTIIVAEYDGGRSQSEGYAKKLIDANNDVTKIVLPGQTHGSILYRKALSDGEDPAIVAAEQIKKILLK